MDQENTGTPNLITPESAPTTSEAAPKTTVETAPPTPTEPSSDKPKKSKGLIAVTAICAILALAGIAFGVYGMFFQPKPSCEANCPEPTRDDNDNSNNQNISANEETEIADTYVLRDLDEKIALLHLSNQTSPTIIRKKGTHPEFQLYQDGGLGDASKLMHLINSLGNYARSPYPAELETIIADSGLEENQKGMIYTVIDADVVKEHYLDTFGKELSTSEGYDDNSRSCPRFSYDSTLNMYYGLGGCGGTSPYDSYYYKTKYTADNDHAYVYVQTALLNYEDGNVYCDVGDAYDLTNAKICGTASTDENDLYVFDESSIDRNSLAAYRFIFNKANNGTYYFSKVEKL